MTALLAGLGLGFSLIVAIGAQNVFVLRQGLRREHVALVAAICAISDAALILIGISGIGAATQALPWLVPVIRWAGAIFLVGYGALAAKRAIRPDGVGLAVDGEGDPAKATTAVSVALTTLALTWLNPHVYLDTVFLLGSVGASHGQDRWVFAVGAMVASVIWFFGLAYGARLLSRWLAGPRAWRFLDAGIAVVMITLGVSLVWPSA
ncbi:LysE/ArgO family amino acid transporter [Propionicimonas sp.]|uniref:LysE/ArgO family amino acid transporter n=1 Tax=Propionicimonas sp. TaxID=1955623 RepID=UPI001824570C|nr:LysE/ArgO family amino acid transporter [Propionicimonas sp.]MBU3976619.1 LysE/ArgO family amino acid transporter [Actinomycetota bacterium]MBA3020381.1 amino acid transporter [Propionicimonas sp.]MBU3986554.1 LysE/ArgO family amino acid transporter [Actinomycetota bacterium]MBU4007294.1 LysE/ArgO family amino acid transporter [Actinomycetota bacterium]MBU4065047.1 LysE/ArgO family amino acid transporter [Actinomycetota bacterium]